MPETTDPARDPIPAADAVPEGAGGLTDEHGDPDAATPPSQASVGAMNVDPTADRTNLTPAPAAPNPTAPEAMDPGVMPTDDTPPVGSSPASATGAILSQEDTANPADPDGPADAIAGGTQPDDTPNDPGLAASPGPGEAPPLG